MSDDLKNVTAERWRHIENYHRESAATWNRGGCVEREHAHAVAADYCARMAEEAEAREKCARGEHDYSVIVKAIGPLGGEWRECRCGAVKHIPPAEKPVPCPLPKCRRVPDYWGGVGGGWFQCKAHDGGFVLGKYAASKPEATRLWNEAFGQAPASEDDPSAGDVRETLEWFEEEAPVPIRRTMLALIRKTFPDKAGA